MWVSVRDYVKGTFVECNIIYPGERNTTGKHKKVLDQNDWIGDSEVDL